MANLKEHVEYPFHIDEAFLNALFSISSTYENQNNTNVSLSYLFDTRVSGSISPAIPGDRSGISNDCWKK